MKKPVKKPKAAPVEQVARLFDGKPKARKAAKPNSATLNHTLTKAVRKAWAAKPKRVAKPGVRLWVSQDEIQRKDWIVGWDTAPDHVGGRASLFCEPPDRRLVDVLRRAGLKRLPKPGQCIPVRMVILED